MMTLPGVMAAGFLLQLPLTESPLWGADHGGVWEPLPLSLCPTQGAPSRGHGAH